MRVTQDGNPPQPNDPDDPNPNDPDPNNPNPSDPDPNNPDKDGKVVSTEEEVATTPLVYPNPFDQELYLRESLIGQDVTLTLYNSLGQAIPMQKEDTHFHLEDAVRPGLYILKVQQGNDTQTVRLVKR